MSVPRLTTLAEEWAKWLFKKDNHIESPNFFTLPDEVQQNFLSGDEARIEKAFRAIIQENVPVTPATMRYIRDRFDPNLKK